MFWLLELGVGLGVFSGFFYFVGFLGFFFLMGAITSNVSLPLDFFHFVTLCSFDVPCSKYSGFISNKEAS